MILKLKVKGNKKKNITLWVQKSKDFDDSLLQIFKFFNDNIRISKWSRFTRFFIISSENPGMLMSMFSTIQDLIPDMYFNQEESIEIEDLPNN